MAITEPYDTIPELPDFDIEFPVGWEPETDGEEDIPQTFDPDNLPVEEDESDRWSERDNFPYHELDDVTWLH